MRRLLLPAALAGTLLTMAVPATGAAAPKRDWSAGAGTGKLLVAAVDASFRYEARQTARGPAGWVSANGDPDGTGPSEPFSVAGPVTCLRVEGRRASFKWRFARATGSGAPLAGGGVQSFVEDNGRPVDGEPVDRVTIDALQPQAVFDPLAGLCLDPDLVAAKYQRLDSGDVRVRDVR